MQVKRFRTNTPIDKLLEGGIEEGVITNIYGPAGSGKTNICLSAILQAKNKVLYIDTEGSFSLDRFRQLGGDEKSLKNIILIEVHDWKEQYEEMQKLYKLIEKENVDIIVIDSLVALYRLELDANNRDAINSVNRQLATAYSVLSKIARQKGLPILVTNQVYGSGDDVEITSNAIARYWSKCLIELKKINKDNCRRAIIRKHRSIPEGKSLDFEIHEKGLKELRRFF